MKFRFDRSHKMPTLNLLPDSLSITDAFVLVTIIDRADITFATPTLITLASTQFFGGTFTVTGTGLTTTVIAGVEYISSGTVTGISITEGGLNRYEFTDLALDGATLGAAMIADREGTNEAAVENLFRTLTYTINGSTVADLHDPGLSFEVMSLGLSASNTYYLGDGADTVTAAGSGDDTIFGGTGSDSLLGNDGNDSIYGEGDNDTIYGGAGNDILTSGSGENDSLYGGDDDDSLTVDGVGRAEGGNGNDNIQTSGTVSAFGGEGNDTVTSFGFDTIFGGTGNDSLNAAFSGLGLTMNGDAGNDTLQGSSADDMLYGGDNDDVINSNDGTDQVFGGDGADVITTFRGTVFGGAGNDTISLISADTGNLYGDGGNDVLNGSVFNDSLFGGDDNDTLNGGADVDSLEGGNGNDRLFGGSNEDTLLGGDGNDQLAGGAGGDSLNGGAGTLDFATYDDSNHGDLVINLADTAQNTGAAAGDSYTEIEGVIGGSGSDTITGDNGGNTIDGQAGNDSISGGNGNDTLTGGGGRDTINGGEGDDRIINTLASTGTSTYDGGAGNDTLEVQNIPFNSAVVIDLQAGTLVVGAVSVVWTGFENYVNATTIGPSLETVYGTSGNNLLDFSALTGSSAITAYGGFGVDTIYGSAGNDTLSGGDGQGDEVYGGAGDDLFLIVGGGGSASEILQGGEGNDTFRLDDAYFTGPVNGGNGARDLIDGSLVTTSLNANLAAGTYTDFGTTFAAVGIEDVIGSTTGDVLTGSNVANILDGRDGNDTLNGGGDSDLVYGGSGNDSLSGDAGGDNLWGGANADQHIGGSDAGIDYARYDEANHGNLVISLLTPASNTGAALGDTYTGIEGLVGGAGNDTITGDTLANYLFGSAGSDLVYGGTGADYLSGDAGGDNLWGGVGADQHYGGTDAGIDYARYDEANHGNLVISLLTPASNTGAALGDTYTGIEGLVGGAGNDTLSLIHL
jgi:Ca2+-binding RTX toxin-like protein